MPPFTSPATDRADGDPRASSLRRDVETPPGPPPARSCRPADDRCDRAAVAVSFVPGAAGRRVAGSSRAACCASKLRALGAVRLASAAERARDVTRDVLRGVGLDHALGSASSIGIEPEQPELDAGAIGEREIDRRRIAGGFQRRLERAIWESPWSTVAIGAEVQVLDRSVGADVDPELCRPPGEFHAVNVIAAGPHPL